MFPKEFVVSGKDIKQLPIRVACISKDCLKELNNTFPGQFDKPVRASLYQLLEWLVDDLFNINYLNSLDKVINDERTI